MAHFTKEQYQRKSESAAIRMHKNAENNALTDEQHEAIRYLCTARHELHSNIHSCIKHQDNDYKQNIIKANIQLKEAGLQSIKGIGTDSSDYIDIDSIEEAIEVEGIDSDDEGYMDWYDDAYYRIFHELEDLNKDIEKYLADIDAKFGTNYCPSGALRVM